MGYTSVAATAPARAWASLLALNKWPRVSKLYLQAKVDEQGKFTWEANSTCKQRLRVTNGCVRTGIRAKDEVQRGPKGELTSPSRRENKGEGRESEKDDRRSH
eukprot:4477098-Pleurochrysis_carterae.AAC.3